MLDHLLAFWVFWGIWIVVPFLLDGTSAFTTFIGVLIIRLKRKAQTKQPDHGYMPVVSVIVPVYNGEATLEECLNSIKDQSYPAQLMEVVVVDNASTDRTVEVFKKVQDQGWTGQMQFLTIPYKGKPWALNAGIHLINGVYIINIDADVILHPDAIARMVSVFESDHEIGAATGGIQVLPAALDAGREAFLIAECEFQEYITAFWMGRQYQSLTNSLFTLAGAFSAFRRETLFKTFLYDKLTVSEDTKLTLDIYQQAEQSRIVCVPEAIAYVTPTPTLSSLYAQRVRWQRGQLEVAALNAELFNFNLLQLRGLSLTRLIMIDHTLIFPRLVWMILFPLMTFFGYPLNLVVSASLFMYAFYALINLSTALTAALVVGPEMKRRLAHRWWISLLMPAYRFMIFLFRVAGSIMAISEPAEWRVRDPVSETKSAFLKLTSQLRNITSQADRKN